MDNIIKTFDQNLLNTGKIIQAEIFYNSCRFNNVQVDSDKLLITSNIILESTKENVITKLWIDGKGNINTDCSCDRSKPCMATDFIYIVSEIFKELG